MQENIRVLIIEDDAFLNRLYADKLSRAGFEVDVAGTGEEATHKIAQESPDVVILDIMLPNENGFDFLSRLKLDEATADIPVIILTNLGQPQDIERGRALGADRYLVKTEFSIMQLPAVVRECAAARRTVKAPPTPSPAAESAGEQTQTGT
jgi:DNA-binding response OmpR family regulator